MFNTNEDSEPVHVFKDIPEKKYSDIILYSPLLKVEHKRRILLVTEFVISEDDNIYHKILFDYVKKTFAVSVVMINYQDVLKLEKEDGYAVVPDDKSLSYKYLMPLK